MRSIKQILVPFVLSPSAEGALKTAIVMSKIYDSKICVLHVKNSNTTDEVHRRAGEICNSQNVQFLYIERQGNIHKEILKAEAEYNADLIIMGAYGISGFQQFWVGSNAFKVISASNCPVITLQNDLAAFNGFHKIMLPLDDSDETRQKINWVVALAKGHDAEVLIFCVSKSRDENTRKKLARYAEQVQDMLDENGIKHSFDESYGNNLAEDCIKYAQLHQCDLISMMTETEKTNSFFMGTYAQQLVSTSPVPVLSIHSRSVKIESNGL